MCSASRVGEAGDLRAAIAAERVHQGEERRVDLALVLAQQLGHQPRLGDLAAKREAIGLGLQPVQAGEGLRAPRAALHAPALSLLKNSASTSVARQLPPITSARASTYQVNRAAHRAQRHQLFDPQPKQGCALRFAGRRRGASSQAGVAPARGPRAIRAARVAQQAAWRQTGARCRATDRGRVRPCPRRSARPKSGSTAPSLSILTGPCVVPSETGAGAGAVRSAAAGGPSRIGAPGAVCCAAAGAETMAATPSAARLARETRIGQDLFDFRRGRGNIPGREEDRAAGERNHHDGDGKKSQTSHGFPWRPSGPSIDIEPLRSCVR